MKVEQLQVKYCKLAEQLKLEKFRQNKKMTHPISELDCLLEGTRQRGASHCMAVGGETEQAKNFKKNREQSI